MNTLLTSPFPGALDFYTLDKVDQGAERPKTCGRVAAHPVARGDSPSKAVILF